MYKRFTIFEKSLTVGLVPLSVLADIEIPPVPTDVFDLRNP